jgi:hypothetical protein
MARPINVRSAHPAASGVLRKRSDAIGAVGLLMASIGVVIDVNATNTFSESELQKIVDRLVRADYPPALTVPTESDGTRHEARAGAAQ